MKSTSNSSVNCQKCRLSVFMKYQLNESESSNIKYFLKFYISEELEKKEYGHGLGLIKTHDRM